MPLTFIKQRYCTIKNECLEMRRLLMIPKSLLVHVLFVEQKLVRIVLRAVRDKLQCARLRTRLSYQFAQDRGAIVVPSPRYGSRTS